MEVKERIIYDYIDGYNNFDIEKMIVNLDTGIKFENISDGVKTMTLIGLPSFKEQAEQARAVFSKRVQTVKSFNHQENKTEVQIDYYAILAIDLPNGLKIGDEIKLQGRSLFKFADDKIIELTDIS